MAEEQIMGTVWRDSAKGVKMVVMRSEGLYFTKTVPYVPRKKVKKSTMVEKQK